MLIGVLTPSDLWISVAGIRRLTVPPWRRV
jgi:hypothetical protein